jgi:citrate lyase subunit beta/citryl-CoA lyase
MACRAHGIEPLDGPYADFRDHDNLTLEAQRAQLLGMGGKWAIHPDQVNAIQQVFTPSSERIAQARKQKAAYQAAQREGLGAINVDGVMVDAASIRIIQSLLDRADILGL